VISKLDGTHSATVLTIATILTLVIILRMSRNICVDHVHFFTLNLMMTGLVETCSSALQACESVTVMCKSDEN